MKQIKLIGSFLIAASIMQAQSNKVQTAWRNLSDYKSSKDASSLMKAKDAIDLAANHDETKDKAKTHLYKAEVYYYLYLNNLKAEKEKLKDITNKQEQADMAYGNVSTVEYELAGKSLEKCNELDKDKAYQTEMAMLGMQMAGDVGNLAVGRFKVKKYEEAIEYYTASYTMMKMMGKKDTASLYMAAVSAKRANKNDKVKEATQYMIQDKIANAVTYQLLYDAKLEMGEKESAITTLKEGRAAFPNDVILMNKEIDYYLQNNKTNEALDMLKLAIQKTPNNAVLYIVSANLYDNLANPKDAANKPLAKPANFEEFLKQAESNYLKATELDPKNYDAWYNMGAMYNNWGGFYQDKVNAAAKITDEVKGWEKKAKEIFLKAIPALEKSLELKPDDRNTMLPLQKLYLITEQMDKYNQIKEKLKK